MRLVSLYQVLPVVVALLCLTAVTHAENVETSDEARAHFQAGLSFHDDPDGPRYEEAYREFQAAYAASPNWKILANLGTCAFYLERDGEALAAYEKFLAEGGSQVSASQREQIERDIARLRVSVVWLTLTVDPANVKATDERKPTQGAPIANVYVVKNGTTKIGIHPGHHRITVSAPGRVSAVWSLDAKPGARLSRSFRLARKRTQQRAADTGKSDAARRQPVQTPPKTSWTSSPTATYVGLATTGTLLTGGVVTGLLASSKKSQYDRENREEDVAQSERLRPQVIRLNLIADVLFAASALAAAGTAYLYFSQPGSPDTTGDRASGSWNIEAGAGAKGGCLSVHGRF